MCVRKMPDRNGLGFAGFPAMELPTISHLQADLVPHRQWALRRWFYANPIWYYHRPSVAHEICPRGRFYELVDEDLREVCRLLYHAGLRTTPSCQGHFYPRDRFERIWEELKNEEPRVRGAGLVIKDSENQRPYLFRNESYRVPWQTFDVFYAEASAHQNVGYLGIIVPEQGLDTKGAAELLKYTSRAASLQSEPDLQKLLGGAVISVTVNAVNPQDRSREWHRFTDHVRCVLDSGELRELTEHDAAAGDAGKRDAVAAQQQMVNVGADDAWVADAGPGKRQQQLTRIE